MPPIDPVENAQLQPQLVPGLIVGAAQDQTFIQEAVLPSVPVPAQKFFYQTWDNFGLQDHGETKRGLNEHSKIILGGKHANVEGFAEEYSSKTPLDVNVLAAAAAADKLYPNAAGLSFVDQVRQGAMALLVFNERIQREKKAARLAFNVANYADGLHTASLNFKTCTIQDMKDAARDMQVRCGRWPDTLTLGFDARTAFDVNDHFLDRVTGGANMNTPATVTNQLLAALLEIKIVVKGMPVIQSAALPGVLPDAGTPIWTTDSAAFLYVGDPRVTQTEGQTNGGQFQTNGSGFFTQFTPSFGKSFYVNVPNVGLRYGAWSWLDEEPNTIEWQKIAEYLQMAQTMKSGYLFEHVTT
jgi:hypothetical protein